MLKCRANTMEQLGPSATILVVSDIGPKVAEDVLRGIIEAPVAQSSADSEQADDDLEAGLSNSATPPTTIPFSLDWQIRNRYYSAFVRFRVFEQGAAQDVPWTAPAVLVLANRTTDPPSGLLSAIQERVGDVDVALVVGTDPAERIPPRTASVGLAAGSEEEVDEEDDEWSSACFRYGFEYVDARHLARASAALQSHPWPPAASRSTTPQLTLSTVASSSQTADAFDDDFAPFVSASAIGDLSPSEADIRATEAFLFGASASPQSSTGRSQGADPFALDEGAATMGDGEEGFASMERMFARLQSLKAQAEGMDESDRRRLAERVALAVERGFDTAQ